MAGSVNKVILIGNLARDPECRSMQNGNKVANVTIATSESWKDKSSGEKKEKAEFHRVVIFGQLADIAERFLKKGSKVYVCGQLQTRKWTDKDGVEKYSTEVVLQGFNSELTMLDGNGRTDGGGSDIVHTNAPGGPRVLSRGEARDVRSHVQDSRQGFDDDIPF